MKEAPHQLSRYPLLVLGLAVLAFAAEFADPSDTEGIRALLLGIGGVCVGAGIVLVAWGHRDPTRMDPSARTRASDIRTPANRIPDTQGPDTPNQ